MANNNNYGGNNNYGSNDNNYGSGNNNYGGNDNNYGGNKDNNENNNRYDKCEIKNKVCVKSECGTVESDEIEFKKVKLTVDIDQNCDTVFVGNCVEYKTTICNDSCADLKDLEFEDILAEGLEYKKDSFKVNGRKENPDVDGDKITFKIKELKKREKLTITFDAKVK